MYEVAADRLLRLVVAQVGMNEPLYKKGITNMQFEKIKELMAEGWSLRPITANGFDLVNNDGNYGGYVSAKQAEKLQAEEREARPSCKNEVVEMDTNEREKIEKQLRLAIHEYNERIVLQFKQGASIRMIAKEEFGSRSPAEVEQIIREELETLERLVDYFAGGDKEVK